MYIPESAFDISQKKENIFSFADSMKFQNNSEKHDYLSTRSNFSQ